MTGTSDGRLPALDQSDGDRGAPSREANTSAKKLSPLSIRLLRADDIESVALACFSGDDFDAIVERLQDELQTQESGDSLTLIAEAEGRICGTLKLDSHGGTGWIHNMAVAPSMRGLGLAGLLINAAVAEAERLGFQRISLHVRSNNSSAIRAYKKAGFQFASVDGMRGEQLRYTRVLRVTGNE